MSQTGTLFLRLGDSPGEGIQWLVRDAKGKQIVSEGTLEQLASVVDAGQRIIVLAPSARMVTLNAKVPPLSGSKLYQALPYALEEFLADDVEKLHFAAGARDAEGRLAVVVVARAEMEAWQALFAQYGLQPHMLVNESLALPWQEHHWTLLLQGDEAILRSGRYEGYVFPYAQLPQIMKQALSKSDTAVPAVIDLITVRADAEGVVDDIEESTGLSVQHSRIDSPLFMFAESVQKDAINLLQGEFSRKEQVGKFWRPWRLTAGLIGALLVMQLGMAGYRLHRLHSLDEQLYAEIIQVYRDAFPDARNIVNPKVQMERKLDELRHGGAGGFSALLASAGEVISRLEGVDVQNLRFKNDTLELELSLQNLPLLDKVKNGLSQKGMQVNVLGVNSTASGVTGRLSVQGGHS